MSGWMTGPGPIQKNGPGRLRGAGLVALNLQPYYEGAGGLSSGQSRHPTVIHTAAPARQWGRLVATRGALQVD